jgi:RIO kinase 1
MDRNALNDCYNFEFEEKEEHSANSSISSDEEETQIKEKNTKPLFRVKDKEDRATVEQVLDPRTRVILMKFLNKKMIKEINGCVSTGKEANVYHAWSYDEKQEYAIKIYKTSILVFKDRDKYIEGEFRFRNGHCRSNPRKMVRLWAEKELRNLKRIFVS